MIRQALFFGTLGMMALTLVADGYRDASVFGALEMVCGIFTAMLTLRVLVDQGRASGPAGSVPIQAA
jgi:hypothetical protein